MVCARARVCVPNGQGPMFRSYSVWGTIKIMENYTREVVRSGGRAPFLFFSSPRCEWPRGPRRRPWRHLPAATLSQENKRYKKSAQNPIAPRCRRCVLLIGRRWPRMCAGPFFSSPDLGSGASGDPAACPAHGREKRRHALAHGSSRTY